jgi:hypothetical protein
MVAVVVLSLIIGGDGMDSKSMTRKDFFVLTFSLVSSAVVATNCSSSNGGGTGGSPGTDAGAGGKGTGGKGGSGAGGTAGSGTGGAAGSAAGGRDGGGDVGNGEVGGISCTLPLPEQQITVASTDTSSHTHTLVIDGTVLNATSDQTVMTGMVGTHLHTVTLTAADLASLRAGNTVTKLASLFTPDSGAAGHTHTYVVGCHAFPDAAVAPSDASPG